MSAVHRDRTWYPVIARRKMDQVLASDWGRLFRNSERIAQPPHGVPDGAPGYPDVGETPAELKRVGFAAFLKSIGILGTCIREAPVLAARRRRLRSHLPA